jgi:hypothetical protein
MYSVLADISFDPDKASLTLIIRDSLERIVSYPDVPNWVVFAFGRPRSLRDGYIKSVVNG